jgi:hypothetical protein
MLFSSPLPFGEREGPARASAWEGEGMVPSLTSRALTLPAFGWAPPSPQMGEGK